MKVIHFEDEELMNELYSHIRSKRLIPLIGSGFSRGSVAKLGQVPSGADMTKYMISSLEKINSSFLGKLDNQTFSKVALFYEKHVDKSSKLRYLDNYFTKVKLTELQKSFIKADWPYMYTLNIDDAIEGNSDLHYEIVLPCQDLNEEFLEQNRCLFKLHGDVHDILKYTKSDFIFSQTQYIKSLENNHYLLGLLKNDLLSNNIFYLGCSLDDEIDLLSQVVEIETTVGKKTTYFVTDKTPDFMTQSQLEDYGITTVIVVDNYNDFYTKIISLWDEAIKVNKDQLDEYFNLKIIKDTNKPDDNIDYLFESNHCLRLFAQKNIRIPYFFIDRDETEEIVNKLENTTIQIIYGHRICGKTFCLFSVMNKIHDRDIYYFPSTVSLNTTTLNEVLSKKNSLILFDSNCLTEDQIKSVVNNYRNLKINKIQVLIAVNTSDRDIVNLIAAADSDDVCSHELSNKFSLTEINKFNSLISYLTMPKFDLKKSILDNIFTIADIIKSKRTYLQIHRPVKLSNAELVTFIILAIKENITSFDAVRFNLVEDIGKIIEELQPIIQFEYTSIMERSSHSGFKVIPNAKYWILKTIGDFAANHKNHKQVVDAYIDIATCIRRNVRNEHKGSKEILNYISFDTINDIFHRYEHGSVKLINEIYDAMNEFLSDYPQYYHQRAKSKLFLYRNDEKGLREAAKYARKAKNDLEVTANLNSPAVQQALSHINFTISTILGRIANINRYTDINILSEAIEAYYIALSDKRNEKYAIHLIRKLKLHPKKDEDYLNELIGVITTNDRVRNLLSNELNIKVNILVNMFRSLGV